MNLLRTSLSQPENHGLRKLILFLASAMGVSIYDIIPRDPRNPRNPRLSIICRLADTKLHDTDDIGISVRTC
jgi:hypothetical protein